MTNKYSYLITVLLVILVILVTAGCADNIAFAPALQVQSCAVVNQTNCVCTTNTNPVQVFCQN